MRRQKYGFRRDTGRQLRQFYLKSQEKARRSSLCGMLNRRGLRSDRRSRLFSTPQSEERLAFSLIFQVNCSSCRREPAAFLPPICDKIIILSFHPRGRRSFRRGAVSAATDGRLFHGTHVQSAGRGRHAAHFGAAPPQPGGGHSPSGLAGGLEPERDHRTPLGSGGL